MELRAFLRLEVHRLRTGISWYGAKTFIIHKLFEIIWLILGTRSVQVRKSYRFKAKKKSK
jgi:hypothetical protein